MRSVIIILTVAAIALISSLSASFAQTGAKSPQTIDDFIKTTLEPETLPGLSIAYFSDSSDHWSKGYGLANAMSGEPINVNTVFSVASTGKLVTSYLALRLVDEGILSLDRPLSDYLETPWLDESDSTTPITLAHILSHTSGLNNDVFANDRTPAFNPGDDFSYSGAGFVYLQAVIEAVTNAPFEETANRYVFDPLDMESSSFAAVDGEAKAHVPWLPVGGGVFAMVAALFAVIACFSLIIARFAAGAWRLQPSTLFIIYIIVCALPLTVIAVAMGAKTAQAIAVGAAPFMVAAAIGYIGAKLVPTASGARSVMFSTAGAILLTGVAALTLNARLLPIPLLKGDDMNAAFTLRSTAVDLIRFEKALIAGENLSPELHEQMLTPQIRIDETYAWALGPAMAATPSGPIYWHWGSNLGYESLIAFDPTQNRGLTILTNGMGGGDASRALANYILGTDLDWKIEG